MTFPFDFVRHLSVPFYCGAISRLPQPRLSRRKRQPGEPPEHTAKQPFRQVALRQQQPIIAGMFHQPSSRLHQPLLQTRERPITWRGLLRGLLPRPAQSYGLSKKLGEGPLLLKPHGSLNWYEGRQLKHVKDLKKIEIFHRNDESKCVHAFLRPRQVKSKTGKRYTPPNYSALYYAASAAEQMKENDARIASERHHRPELVFLYLEICIENAKRLQGTARVLLAGLGVKCKLPKHPDACYQMVGAYRNAFTHDPVLGRAVTHGRELVPPPDMLPRTRRKDDFLRWSDTERIPTDQMVDCSKCQEELWEKLSDFLQDTWGTLASAFMTARTKDEFIQDVSLSAYFQFVWRLEIYPQPALSLHLELSFMERLILFVMRAVKQSWATREPRR